MELKYTNPLYMCVTNLLKNYDNIDRQIEILEIFEILIFKHSDYFDINHIEFYYSSRTRNKIDYISHFYKISPMQIIEYMIKLYKYRMYKEFMVLDNNQKIKMRDTILESGNENKIDFFNSYTNTNYQGFGYIQGEKYSEEGNSKSYKFCSVTNWKEMDINEEKKEGKDHTTYKIYTKEYYDMWVRMKDIASSSMEIPIKCAGKLL